GGGDLLRQRLAQAGAAVGVHEDQVLLEEDGAVQAGGEDEVALAQGAGGAEFVQDVFRGHAAVLALPVRQGKSDAAMSWLGLSPSLSRQSQAPSASSAKANRSRSERWIMPCSMRTSKLITDRQ